MQTLTEQRPLAVAFTSTGEKLYHHADAMAHLRNGQAHPIVAHAMITDVCAHACGFCSVGMREGQVLPFHAITGYYDQLIPLGLKAAILSGGGNPALYKSDGKDINDVIDALHSRGLEIGMITDGMPLKEYPGGRKSWVTVRPETLDKLTWCRISMAGLDYNHKEKCVFVPDFDRSKTTLGFSWIMADLYEEPAHKHGWVSTPEDCTTDMPNRKIIYATDQLPWIEEQIKGYVDKYQPDYVRALCNCLQPDLIPQRHALLTAMGNRIDPTRFFSQIKIPQQPHACYKIATHPVLNCDGWAYNCDSVVLQRTAGHKFGSAWRVCRWDEIGAYLSKPLPKGGTIPNNICENCVFFASVEDLANIIETGSDRIPVGPAPRHANFL